MTPERWQQVAEIYQAALVQPAAARAGFVAERCGADAALRGEVESLLAQDQASVVVDRRVDGVAASVLGRGTRLTPGSQVGPYRVVELLGEGGMGQVYRARDTKLQRDVALKILPDGFVHDADRVARFTREAQVLASLNHPNIAAIHGFEDSGEVHALVLELVDGPTLADQIARGPLPVDEALPIARQIGEALEAAHEHGIVHRDLKPANIKVRDDGTVKVLDFGLAKLTTAETAGVAAPLLTHSPTVLSPAVTTAGVILGTAAYMSPEQAKGRPADKRSDIWAFGCVLFEMLTAKRAFPGDDVSDTLAAVLRGEPDWPALGAGVPERVVRVVRVCVQKDLRSRAGDIHDVRLALDGAFDAASVAVTSPPRPWWRRALLPAAASLAGAVAMALSAWVVWPNAEPRPVSRFVNRLAPGEFFRGNGWQVVALSRDGRRIAYNTVSGLYVRSLGDLEGTLIQATESSPNRTFYVNPFFSPDGRSIGYWHRNQLFRASVDGGPPIRISEATPPFGVSWEADDTILFGQRDRGIMRVPASGGSPTLVIAAKQGEPLYGPQLLPDGDSVLFSTTSAVGPARWDAGQIVVQSLSTGARKVVLDGASDARYLSTGHLLYALGTGLFAVPFDVEQMRVAGQPVPIADGLARAGNAAQNSSAANYAVSDDGTLVYLRGRFTTAGAPIPLGTLVWVDRSGREEAVGTPPRRYVYPRISPDGTRVAVSIGGEGIWIWDIRRRALQRFTLGPQNSTFPVWSRDGRRLVWNSGAPLNIFWQAADGTGTPEALMQNANAQRPSGFTPDGKYLIFSQGPPSVVNLAEDIGLMAVDGERRVTWLLQTKSIELNAQVSPNGQWIAYESDETGETQVVVRSFPGVDQGRWLVSTNGGYAPTWAPSGKELFYMGPDGGLMSVQVNTGNSTDAFGASPPTVVSRAAGYFSPVANQLGRTYDVSIDGSRFLRIKIAETQSAADDAPPEIVVVLNWFEELKQRVPVP